MTPKPTQPSAERDTLKADSGKLYELLVREREISKMLEQKCDTLKAEVEKLREKAEALDWLEQGNHYMVFAGANIGTKPTFEFLINKKYRTFNSLITAIQAAKKGQGNG
jgi:hypothetical protein